MAVMTAQAPLPLAPAGAVQIGEVVALVEEGDGSGRVYVRGELTHLWGPGDETGRRLAAVQLVHVKAATGAAVATGFGIGRETLRLWMRAAETGGTAGLVPARPGPKGPSKLTPAKIADIRARRAAKASLRTIAQAVDVSTDTVRRALADAPQAEAHTDGEPEDEKVVVLAEPAARTGQRAAARAGQLVYAQPIFTAAGRVPLAGLLLALPALEATDLLPVAKDVYGQLPDGFYGLDTMLLEGVFRALAGAPRAENAARFAPADLGRVLGMDRAPEVKTIRRKIAQLATAGKAADLIAGMAAHHLNRPTLTHDSHDSHDDSDSVSGDGEVGLVLYVDGHVRAYTGTKKIAKTHSARLRFPAPATVETWVSDAAGDPVLVVMAEPGTSLAGELRALLPDLRAAVGDERRVLVGFDRGGWSPALFAHMHAAGFDVLTWRKGRTEDIATEEFVDVTFVDETGRQHPWRLADTIVDLPLGSKDEDGAEEVFTMRQVTRLDTKKGVTRQVHILTTRTDLDPGQVVHRMGSRWRQENYFRYARMHLGLDSHDSYTAHADDPDRSVPNPAKRRAHQGVQAAYAREQREKARAEAALLAARSPDIGEATISNQAHNAITAPWHAAQDDLAAARAVHADIPTRVRLGDLAPDQQVLDTETKLIHHAIKIAAFNTTTAIARGVRLHTRFARADQEAYTLTRQALTHTGDILPDPDTGTLTIRLDPLPTARETAAVAELCEHLTATATTYPGTNLTLRYQIKNRP